YKELSIPPSPEGRHRIEKNALHIWPRKTFMLIALPNLDGSFTCTFFFSHKGAESFESLDTPAKVNAFFLENFPDVMDLIPELTEEFFSNPTGSMVTVKGLSWHAGGAALLLGDAAHAIVPFFGQGMNCAFEDCTYLNRLISTTPAHEIDWAKLFREFETRKNDTDAIADLAVENFFEMRDLVAQPKFQLKKKIERILEERHPGRFVPKYTMVTFRRIPYSVARERGKVQENILNELCESISEPEQVDLKLADELIRLRLSPLEDPV
ncbi:MAG: FAD-dependent monooxygenase, partial [bacterium]